jgi:NADH/F420H2 dehydrogenase subunit C
MNECYEQLKLEASHLTFTLDVSQELICTCSTDVECLNFLDMLKNKFGFNLLIDLTAYDNEDRVDGPKRFIVVYQLLNLANKQRVRVKLPVDLQEEIMTLTSIFEAANWLEREVYDMYGIIFKSHPNLKRILMDERFAGHPLRKEYPIKQREPFADSSPIKLTSPTRPKTTR